MKGRQISSYLGLKEKDDVILLVEEGIEHQERMKQIHQSIARDLEWNCQQQKEYYDKDAWKRLRWKKGTGFT
jgi:hypothetical protein